MAQMKWDWPKQTLFGFGGKEIGDCFRCCIAAILQIPAFEVPHFVEIAMRQGKSCNAEVTKWIHDKGYWFVQVDGGASWHGHSGFWVSAYHEDIEKLPALPWIGCGPTVRSENSLQTHAVVYEGEKLVYDPHPSEKGLLAVTSRYLIIPYYATLQRT